MKGIDWVKFKATTEEHFKNATIENAWGWQVQKNSKWNNGLNEFQIKQLEEHFKFKFPLDYFEMLKAFNGFQTMHISIDPDNQKDDEFDRICYQYPLDLEKTRWLIQEVYDNLESAKEALEDEGFNSDKIEGFIPIYAHRALVVFKNKHLSPVLSIHGNDIIVYGGSILEYWCREFEIDYGS